MVPPVFWKKMAYFYTNGRDGDQHTATLRAYEYSSLARAPELKCTLAMPDETS